MYGSYLEHLEEMNPLLLRNKLYKSLFYKAWKHLLKVVAAVIVRFLTRLSPMVAMGNVLHYYIGIRLVDFN